MSVRSSGKSRPTVVRNGDCLALSFDELRVQSEMRLAAPDELVLGYTRTMMGFLLFDSSPARIAMIGLGGGSLLKYCHANLPDTALEVAEIDPDVIALRGRFFIPPDDARLKMHCVDGAAFIAAASNRYDVLMIDAFDEHGQPPGLATQRFYNDCHDCLTERGIMVVNLTDVYAGFEPMLARMRYAFKNAVIAIDAEDSTNQIAFAGKGGVLDVADEQLMMRLERLQMHLSLNLYRTTREVQWVRSQLGAQTAD